MNFTVYNKETMEDVTDKETWVITSDGTLYFVDYEALTGDPSVFYVLNGLHNKKYRLEKLEEFNGHNTIYNNIEGATCYLAYLKVGERGWILWEDVLSDYFGTVHRIHTSLVKIVEYINDSVILLTENTQFTFKEIR